MADKIVLITGSTRGIGRATALRFSREGYRVIINGLHKADQLTALQNEIRGIGCDCISFLGDVGNHEFVFNMTKQIRKTWGSVDVLINNAGISHVGMFTEMKMDDWNQMIATNLDSIFTCCHAVVPDMISKKSGKIINISSLWGSIGASCEVAYSAAKGGVNAFTKALAKELAPSNIQVNAIACGAIDTEMNSGYSKEEIAAICNDIPTGRFGTPAEVADFILMLSTSPSYLTGQVINFDGGWC